MEADSKLKLGIALETLGKEPINGLRHMPENQTNGWYIWCGTEFSEAEDFFKPLHVEHLKEVLPSVLKFLDLAPGHRFLIDNNGYEDVWFDENLI
ncbi:hypothetical protein [Gilvibacter sediminis]|uniref:immunity protein Imm33 domain-containing protein n=1 Tax=Gilvibacter sediminis TaxID=379071 RepID=UPI0023501C51|nr:hypothetical protein [Gilvibacter sediminis]MDC7998955.1 hypothetical protein [Gilvibacter sediminis]